MPDTDPQTVPVLVLVRDLLLGSRVTAEARAQGIPVKLIRDPAKLTGQAGRSLVVDLNLDGAIAAASAWTKATGRPVTGFVAHTDAPTMAAAREAGIQDVLARSQLVQQLPQLLARSG
ncbi:MAG: hypothetical protein ACREIT_05775 [Tepidisphaeraceae bacterium]